MKNKSKTLAITGLLSLSFACLPVAAAGKVASPGTSKPLTATQLTKQGSKCDNALASVKREIGNNRDINVTFEWRNISDNFWQEGIPAEGKRSVWVIMQGNYHQVWNVMNSPQFRTAQASQIINNCSNVGVVQVGIQSTDVIEPHGVVNGRVRAFECVERPRGDWNRRPSWGFYYCNP